MWRRIAVVAVTVAVAGLGAAPMALAADTDATDPNAAAPRNSDDQTGLVNLGDLQLLNNLNVCPDVNALIPIGDILGILSPGTATATTADAPITCTVTSDGRQVGDR